MRQCTVTGYHPGPWHASISVALTKPRKKAHSQPRSYRFIQLLNTMGKVLEKLQATRLTNMAMTYVLVPQTQFGALPGKSTIDAVMSLVHDAEAAHNHGLVSSTLMFDITGAFGFISHPVLLRTLRSKGLPTELIQWVEPFLKDRITAVMLDGKLHVMRPVDTGIPQGSPISLILFVIIISLLHCDDLLPQHFNRMLPDGAIQPSLAFFVDDGKIQVASKKLKTNVRLLEAAFRSSSMSVTGWAFGLTKTKPS